MFFKPLCHPCQMWHLFHIILLPSPPSLHFEIFEIATVSGSLSTEAWRIYRCYENVETNIELVSKLYLFDFDLELFIKFVISLM